MKQYDSYKDSGVEWIGEVPSHWEVRKIKTFSPAKRGASPRPIDDPKYFDENGEFSWVRIADVSASDKYLTTTTQKLSNLGSSLSVKRYPGDIFISIAGTVGKPIISSIKCCIHDGFVYFPYLKNMNTEFLYYIFMSGQPYLGLGKLGTQLNLNTETIGNIYIPYPSVEVQNLIVSYLNKKCSEIDNVISAQQKRIALLQELKQSVITHAVTKGLNPNVEMKDSGVEWIDKIPSNWNIVRLKNDCSLKGRIGWNGLRSEEFEKESYAYLVTGQDFVSSDIDWSKCYQINKKRYDEDPCIQLENGDLLITKDGTIGKIAKVSNMDKPACLNSGIFVLKQKTRKEFVQGYLYWSLYSDLLKEFNSYTSTGTTILHLYQNVFENMPLVVPPKKEQQEISDYLDKKTKAIDLSLSKAQHQVELLQEYKQSLITEVVTGKRKVC